MEMAMKVIEFGHTKLAFISAVTAQNDRASARLNGIQNAMSSAGLNANDLRCIETNYGIEEGAVAFDRLMTNGPRPTAILCGNDVLAVGALRRARELKIAVPQDVSIVGFDDIELAQVAYPPLTTVHVPHREMGRRAGQVLVEHVKNGTPIKSVQLPTRPILRETLAPVKAGS